MPYTTARKLRNLRDLKFIPEKWDINFKTTTPYKRNLRIPMFMGKNPKAQTILDWCCANGQVLAWLRPLFPSHITPFRITP